jgi:uncharacterized membrane protein YciS (DUF1049 family)
MRLIGVFIWIVLGAIVLWFFTLNLNQYITVHLFNLVYEDVNLVTVIFISLFIGVVIGALLVSAHIIKAKSEVAGIRRDNKKLIKELEGLRNLSIDEIPEADTKIEPENEI